LFIAVDIQTSSMNRTFSQRLVGWIFVAHGQVTIIFIVSVCLCLFVQFFSAIFDPISIKLGHVLYVWV